MGIVRFLVRCMANGTLILFATHAIPGFSLTPYRESVIAGAFVFALLATFLRPLLLAITTPLRWITLGLFSIVIHAIILLIADAMLDAITIQSGFALMVVAFLFGMINAII